MSGADGGRSPRDRLRFALVGCGGFGKELAAFFMEVADLVALCDVQPAHMAQTAAALRVSVPHFIDYRALLDAGGLDAVVIAAPNSSTPITIAAAQAGVHVFCEKAMARTVPECWQMVRACRQHVVRLMVGHKRRLRPAWARLVELTADALLGPPLSITAPIYVDNRPCRFFGTWWADPAQSGGFFHVHGVHVLDWFRAMCGDVTQVTALVGPQHDPRYLFPDVIHATFRFASGALASISGGQSFPLHVFKESEVPWGECRHGGFKLSPHRDHIDLRWQRLDEAEAHHERYDDLGIAHAFRREAGDFVRWVQDDVPPCLTWVEGLRCVEMMEAAYRSAAGGQPVALPLYPELEDA